VSRASYVLFPIGERQFALPSEVVAEFIRPSRLHVFPHTTALLQGVLVRRGRLVPVLDVSPLLAGTPLAASRFYLVVRRAIAGTEEWTAFPVSGECQLVSAEEQACGASSPRYVTGSLSLTRQPGAGKEGVAVVDLQALLNAGRAEARA